MIDTFLDIQAGLPYSRRLRITDGKNTWTTRDQFEVRSEVRASTDPDSTLKATLTPYFTADYDANDIVIDLQMTGAETRTIASGYYDIVVSDVGATDARGLCILKGQLRVTPLVTAGA